MPDNVIDIEIKGMDRVIKALDRFPNQIKKNFSQAGAEAAGDVILPTQGLQNYPPFTAANQPPVPYYIRGRGTQTASGNRMESENLGKQWFTKREGFNTRIYNRASYAQYVHDDKQQAKAMAAIGWRKLFEVAKAKINDIKHVYNAWVAKTIRDLGL